MMFQATPLLFAAQSPSPPSPWVTYGIPGAVVTLPLLHHWRRKRRAGESLAGRPVVPTHPTITPPARALDEPARPVRRAWALAIDSIREAAGSPPRRFDSSIARYLKLFPPSWVGSRSNKLFSDAYKRQAKIRRDGMIVWATFAQANQLLFKPGPLDHPASVIYAEDQTFDSNPAKLREIAHALFELKGSNQADPEAAQFANILTNELIRAPRLRVPARFAGNAAVYHTSMIFPRKHLPSGYLSGSIFPAWIDPKLNGLMIMVPAAYWPQELLDNWRRDARVAKD